jgi:hypothetical protein
LFLDYLQTRKFRKGRYNGPHLCKKKEKSHGLQCVIISLSVSNAKLSHNYVTAKKTWDD